MDEAAARLLGVNPDRTGRTLRELRTRHGYSLRELASLLYCDHSQLGNIEKSRRWPADRKWVVQADAKLAAGGALVAAWDSDQKERLQYAATMRALEAARVESDALLVAPDGADLDDIQEDVLRVGRAAGIENYEKTLKRALAIRGELSRRIREGAHRPDRLRDLYVALSRVYGVLSYLTLDLGRAEMAHSHVKAAFKLADAADHDAMRAWARGTQSLAFRFDKEFEQARDAAIDGLKYVNGSTGTAEPRLLCGLAASQANLGDEQGAVDLLRQADRVRGRGGADELPGPLFGFSEAKQLYYHGFSLMWATEPRILLRAVEASREAIAAWQETSSPGDEMLTYIYLATACVRLHDLEGSRDAVEPILRQPVTASFSWVNKRLTQLDELLGETFPGSHEADEFQGTLRTYIDAA